MKIQILSGLAGLVLVSAALGTDASYVNNSVLIWPPGAPPTIDARAFVNKLAFIDNTYNSLFLAPFETANTINYTNLGVLASITGFRFDDFNSDTALYSSAANFYNGSGAVINCGGTNYGPYFATNVSFYGAFFSLGGDSECLIWATNIINRGTIDMGVDSLLSMAGQNVSLSGGLLNMEGFETGDLFGNLGLSGAGFRYGGLYGPAGWFDGYWGAGQTPDSFNPATSFGFGLPMSPSYWVTNRNYSRTETFLELPLANAYQNPAVAQGPSNNLYQIVFLQNADASVSNNVYFSGDSVVEWVWSNANPVTGLTQTNHLFFEDSITSQRNLRVVANGTAPPNTGYRPTYIPTNYFFFESSDNFFGTPATPGLLSAIGPNTNFVAEYTAYEALFEPTTVIVSDVAGQTYSNAPGRIEITATNQLDLRSSRISGLNYVRLTATNNFLRDANTRILTAVADYNLGVTNATLAVTNLMPPTCPRLNGYVDVFSTRWTNVETVVSAISTNTYTNRYYITMVDSHLTNVAPTALQNLTLHATNVVISDVLNVIDHLSIDAYNVLITTNGKGALSPAGQLNFPTTEAWDASALPRLQTLTNWGVISVPNNAEFGSGATPLLAFVNHGSVSTLNCSISAGYFENTGLVDSGPGPIYLTANSAVLSGGVFNAPLNDIVLNSGSLFISNTVVTAGHGLTLQATGSLTDSGSDSGNRWSAGLFGFNLPSKPPVASLLGTTISDNAPEWSVVTAQWAGADLGAVAAGYDNNAALGRLFLDGGLNSSFVLSAPNGNNALYVDYLDLRNSIATFDESGNLPNLQFDPGMKLYYAQLLINGVSYAEKLNHKNNGALNWVPSYAGAFSSTNMVYPDGTTNRLNLALVQSCDIDSNGNGIPNCMDPAPVFIASQVVLSVAITNSPPRTVALSWNSLPLATNTVFFQPSGTIGKWQVLTNFVSGRKGGPQRFLDAAGGSGRRYRVRVAPPAP